MNNINFSGVRALFITACYCELPSHILSGVRWRVNYNILAPPTSFSLGLYWYICNSKIHVIICLLRIVQLPSRCVPSLKKKYNNNIDLIIYFIFFTLHILFHIYIYIYIYTLLFFPFLNITLSLLYFSVISF